MLRGLYTAVSAMQTTEKKIDVISNNLANVNTTSFKKDVVVSEAFPEVLLHKINGNIPSQALSANTAVEVKKGENAYQLSTQGGFFTAQTPMGISYSRETSFAVDESGYLKTYHRDNEGNVDTTYGNYILDANGKRVNVENQPFEINELGQVVANGQVLGNLVNKGGPNVIGTINGGLRINSIETNFLQGSLEETGNPLHMAIKGNGFFHVANIQGESFYTRNGTFTLNDNGEIITSEGYFLLNDKGWSIPVGGTDFQLTEKGEIIIDGVVADQIAMADITNTRALRKHGEGYYYVEKGMEIESQPFQGDILQGYLEGSNVNPIKEMVEMISSYRNYESNQKVVKAYDELLQRAVNDIGKL